MSPPPAPPPPAMSALDRALKWLATEAADHLEGHRAFTEVMHDLGIVRDYLAALRAPTAAPADLVAKAEARLAFLDERIRVHGPANLAFEDAKLIRELLAALGTPLAAEACPKCAENERMLTNLFGLRVVQSAAVPPGVAYVHPLNVDPKPE